MAFGDVELVVRLADPGLPAEQLDVAAEDLREDLEDLGASVGRAGGPAPEGARSIETISAGVLLVSVARPLLTGAATVLTTWLTERAGRRVEVTLAGRTIVVTGGDRRQVQDLIDAFVAERTAVEDTDDGPAA